MKIRGFKVCTEKFENNIIETEYECDLIDHDTTGDIRLYDYREDAANLDRTILVAKFESHVEQIIKVEYFDLGDKT